MIVIEIPGREPLKINHVVLDYNGTAAVDGMLLKGVKDQSYHTDYLIHTGPHLFLWYSLNLKAICDIFLYIQPRHCGILLENISHIMFLKVDGFIINQHFPIRHII